MIRAAVLAGSCVVLTACSHARQSLYVPDELLKKATEIVSRYEAQLPEEGFRPELVAWLRSMPEVVRVELGGPGGPGHGANLGSSSLRVDESSRPKMRGPFFVEKVSWSRDLTMATESAGRRFIKHLHDGDYINIVLAAPEAWN